MKQYVELYFAPSEGIKISMVLRDVYTLFREKMKGVIILSATTGRCAVRVTARWETPYEVSPQAVSALMKRYFITCPTVQLTQVSSYSKYPVAV